MNRVFVFRFNSLIFSGLVVYVKLDGLGDWGDCVDLSIGFYWCLSGKLVIKWLCKLFCFN